MSGIWSSVYGSEEGTMYQWSRAPTVDSPAQDTGLFVALVYSRFSVGRLSSSIIKFTPKVGVDRIGSGWERQDESWSKSHDARSDSLVGNGWRFWPRSELDYLSCISTTYIITP